LYTNKEGSWTSTNLEEIERLIAFLVYAGLVKVKSEIESYCSVKTVYHGLWAREIISQFRYKALMAFLNVVDPVTEDPNNKRHQQLYQPLQNIAVDEHMVKSRNRPRIRQFMKDKPTKWGINLWVATDSSNGYTCDFEIYYL
jgi:hypothetical protein